MSRLGNKNVPVFGTNGSKTGTSGQGHSRVRKTGHMSRCPGVPFPLSASAVIGSFFRRLANGWPIASAWWLLQYELSQAKA